MSVLDMILAGLLILTNFGWYAFFTGFRDETIKRYRAINKVVSSDQKRLIDAHMQDKDEA